MPFLIFIPMKFLKILSKTFPLNTDYFRKNFLNILAYNDAKDSYWNAYENWAKFKLSLSKYVCTLFRPSWRAQVILKCTKFLSSHRGSVVDGSDWEPWGCGFGPWPTEQGRGSSLQPRGSWLDLFPLCHDNRNSKNKSFIQKTTSSFHKITLPMWHDVIALHMMR